jgi:amino acid transporter
MRSRRGSHFTTPCTLLLILSTPSTAFNTITTFISMENIRVYLAIAIFIYIFIVYKQVTKIVKNI